MSTMVIGVNPGGLGVATPRFWAWGSWGSQGSRRGSRTGFGKQHSVFCTAAQCQRGGVLIVVDTGLEKAL